MKVKFCPPILDTQSCKRDPRSSVLHTRLIITTLYNVFFKEAHPSGMIQYFLAILNQIPARLTSAVV